MFGLEFLVQVKRNCNVAVCKQKHALQLFASKFVAKVWGKTHMGAIVRFPQIICLYSVYSIPCQSQQH